MRNNEIDRETEKRIFNKVFQNKKRETETDKPLETERERPREKFITIDQNENPKCNCGNFEQTEISLIDLDNSAIETFLICSRCKTKRLLKVVLLETAINRLTNTIEILKTQITLDKNLETKTEKLFRLTASQKFLDRLSYMNRTKTYIE